MKICILDPSLQTHDGLPSNNLGDLIIRNAIIRELRDLDWIESPEFDHVSTHEFPGRRELDLIRKADLRIVAGSNLIGSDIVLKRQWRLKPWQFFQIKDVLLMGVGWWQYQGPPTWTTKFLMSNVFSKDKILSVRDEYTKSQVEKLGFANVLNTNCPTMWRLPGICASIPINKADQVLFTLTDYNRDTESDVSLIETLTKSYKRVYFWPQGAKDLEYFKSLNSERIEVVDRTLEGYQQLLNSDSNLDYVGTRLHGGILALSQERRALILGVDNRAKEISTDTGLPVVDRKDISAIRNWIDTPSSTSIHLNQSAIDKWVKQFEDLGFTRKKNVHDAS